MMPLTFRGPSTARPRHAIGLALVALALVACAEAPTAFDDSADAARTAAAPAAGLRGAQTARYIVQFNDTESDPAGLARQLVSANGGALRFAYTRVMKGFAAELPPQAVEALRRNPRIRLIEPDLEVTMSSAGAQSSPPSWGLDRIDQRTRPLDQQYTWANNGGGVHAYIFDTGIRSTHEDFAGRMGTGWSAFSDAVGTEDCQGHGTHVAGTVGGTRFGVAKGVTLHSVRVLGCTGSGSTSGIIAGLDWVVRSAPRPAVVNMSLGGGFSSSMNTAVQNASAAGVVVVVAAGNSNADACTASPASAPAAITVGASTSGDAAASYSNWGSCVDLFAPGSSIVSTDYASNTAQSTKSGTSMASPHVAGAAAMFLAANPAATPAQIEAALAGNATADLLTNMRTTSPNLLLFTGFIGGGSPPPPPPPNAAPTAQFAASCSALTCAFTDQSSDSDGSIASWRWEFGDGSTSTARNPGRTYAAAGTYTVRLTVTDDRGATASTTRQVTAQAPPNAAPTASFTAQCQGNRAVCNVNGSGSSDDRGVVRYEWDFGDGTRMTTTGPTYQHTHRATGTFTIRLTVFDAEGLSGTTTRSVTVRRL
jgi:subtilisin family serine protease